MSTVISADTPYASVGDLFKRFDYRVIADLCADSTGPKPTNGELIDKDSQAGGKLYEALRDASGDVEAACLVGGRYTVADLQGLTGNAQATLLRITCVIALDYIFQRRSDPEYKISLQIQQAKEFLAALADGGRIFGLQETVDAGTAELVIDLPEDVERRQMVTTSAQRLFGRRNNKYPQG